MQASRFILNCLLLGSRKRNLGINSKLKSYLVSKFIFVDQEGNFAEYTISCLCFASQGKET